MLRAPVLLTWINFNPSMESSHMPKKVWNVIICPLPNFNGVSNK